MPDPDIIRAAFCRHSAVFRRYTPFGVLLECDMAAVLKCTARDTGATLAAVMEELGNG